MKVSVFQGRDASQTRLVSSELDVSIDTLGALICSTNWAPGIFVDGLRTIKTFKETSLLALDIDGGCTVNEARQLFKGYRYVLATSRNHQLAKGDKPACDRFRLILELDKPVLTDEDFKATWYEAQKLCPAIDPACKDSSRFFYPCRELIETSPGKLFSSVGAVKKVQQYQPVTPQAQQRGKPAKRTTTFVTSGAPDGQWHAELVAACMDLKQQGWSQEQAAAYLVNAAPTLELDAHDETTIDDVWANRTPKHPPRLDMNLGVRDVVLESHLLVSLADKDTYRFVNLETGRGKKWDRSVLYDVFDKDEVKRYLKQRKLLAEFVYEPSIGKLLDTKSTVARFNQYVPAPWRAESYYSEQPIEPCNVPPLYAEYLLHLTDNHQASYEYLLDWVANSLRRPCLTILTAIGAQGVGKGVLGTMLELLHGPDNFVKVRDEVFKNRFNSQLANRTLVYVDEADLRTKEAQNRIKDVINGTIEIEAKGKDAISCPNYASYYLSSNNMDAVKIEAGDRRFSIIQLTNVKLKDTSLIGRVGELLNPMNVAELGRALWHRKVTNDMLSPFRSERAMEVMEAGMADWEAWVVFEWCQMRAGQTLQLRDLQEDIVQGCGLRMPPGRNKIQDLADRYPDYLKVTKTGESRSLRTVEVFGEPNKARGANTKLFTIK